MALDAAGHAHQDCDGLQVCPPLISTRHANRGASLRSTHVSSWPASCGVTSRQRRSRPRRRTRSRASPRPGSTPAWRATCFAGAAAVLAGDIARRFHGCARDSNRAPEVAECPWRPQSRSRSPNSRYRGVASEQPMRTEPRWPAPQTSGQARRSARSSHAPHRRAPSLGPDRKMR